MKHWISYDFSIQSMLSFIFFYRSVTINCAVECPMGSQHMCRVSIQNHPDTACIKSETAVQRSAFSSAPRIGTVPWRALQSTNLVQHHPEGRNKNITMRLPVVVSTTLSDTNVHQVKIAWLQNALDKGPKTDS